MTGKARDLTSKEPFTQVDVYESCLHEIESLERVDCVHVLGRRGESINVSSLVAPCSEIPGVESVVVLTVDDSCMMSDLSVLCRFPGIKHLVLHGRRIRSLRGIEACKDLHSLTVHTPGNRKRSLEGIDRVLIKSLTISFASEEDLVFIARSRTITDLVCYNSPDLELNCLSEVPIAYLRISGRRCEEIQNAGCIPTLRSIECVSCPNLKRFSGYNGGVRVMSLNGCGKIDFGSVGGFSDLARLSVASDRRIWPLKKLATLVGLEVLDLSCIPRELDSLSAIFPRLRRVSLDAPRLRKQFLNNIRMANPGVEIQSVRDVVFGR